MTTPERWHEIDRIFAAALEREPATRAAFLDEACAGDEQLRKEVESLLAHDLQESLIGGQAVEEASRLLARGKTRELTGDRIGPYLISRSIGGGGMGEVYLAKDKLGRMVALKLLNRHFERDKSGIARFQQEAQTLLALNHPNIVTIYDIGEIDSVYYIASELVEGETLRQRLDRGDLELSDALEIAIQISTALTAAHEKGIVHRDIKPENVMIRRDGYVKVLDFGIAKLTGENAGTDPEALTVRQVHTAEGTVVGTAPYMSPEQARGLTVDARTDVWSLGVVIYETIAGRKPFWGDTTQDVLKSVLEKEPPPLARYAHDIPEGLEWIVSRALRKEREARYQTANDLLVDLKELKKRIEFEKSMRSKTTGDAMLSPGGTPTSDRGTVVLPTVQTNPTNVEYIVTEIKRHRLAFIISLLVLAAGSVGLGAYLHARNTAAAIDSIAVLPFQNRSTETDTEYLSDGLAESLVYRLSQLPNLRVSPTSSVFRYKGKEMDPVKVGQELGVRAVLSGRIVQRGDNLTISAELVDVRDNALLWGEQYDRKMSELLATQREIAREIVEKLKLKVSGNEQGLAKHYTESNEAYQLYLKGRFYWDKRTGEALKKGTEYFDQAIEKDPSFALAYAGLADCYVVPASLLPPREAMPKGKAAAMRALELDETLAEAHTSLGRVLAAYEWNWTSAEKEFKRAIELNPRYATAHQWYGGLLEATGRRNEAIAERKRAQELDPLSLVINFELGIAFFYSRDYDKAIEQFQKTLELDPNFPPPHIFLPAAYEQKGMYSEAMAEFKKAIPLKGGSEMSLTKGGLGRLYAILGKKNEARTQLDELKQLAAQEYVPATSVALVYTGLGEKDEAFAWLEKGYEERAFQMQWLGVEPRWDSLRSDPRFADLVRRIGLPQ
jgi:eukaryotic-like serine/threonine-protein kinase